MCVSGESGGTVLPRPDESSVDEGLEALGVLQHSPAHNGVPGRGAGALWGSMGVTLHSAHRGGWGSSLGGGGLEGQGLTASSCWWWQLQSPEEQCWEYWCWVCWWCGAEHSGGSAPFPAQPRADCWHMTLVISPAQKHSAQGILMDL